MKKLFFILLILVPVLLSFSLHKYYLSVTDLVYNRETQSVQMITRLFYDDLEAVLQERYDETITVDAARDQDRLDTYIAKYLKRKLNIQVNGVAQALSFVGKEYEDDYVVCYTEIENVDSIESLEIENTLLMDLFPDQKNMMHTDVLEKKKSLLLISGNAKAVLNFSE